MAISAYGILNTQGVLPEGWVQLSKIRKDSNDSNWAYNPKALKIAVFWNATP
jgi:hypothetical protein